MALSEFLLWYLPLPCATEKRASQLVHQMLMGINHLWKQNIVHRDLKVSYHDNVDATSVDKQRDFDSILIYFFLVFKSLYFCLYHHLISLHFYYLSPFLVSLYLYLSIPLSLYLSILLSLYVSLSLSLSLYLSISLSLYLSSL